MQCNGYVVIPWGGTRFKIHSYCAGVFFSCFFLFFSFLFFSFPFLSFFSFFFSLFSNVWSTIQLENLASCHCGGWSHLASTGCLFLPPKKEEWQIYYWWSRTRIKGTNSLAKFSFQNYDCWNTDAQKMELTFLYATCFLSFLFYSLLFSRLVHHSFFLFSYLFSYLVFDITISWTSHMSLSPWWYLDLYHFITRYYPCIFSPCTVYKKWNCIS